MKRKPVAPVCAVCDQPIVGAVVEVPLCRTRHPRNVSRPRQPRRVARCCARCAGRALASVEMLGVVVSPLVIEAGTVAA